VRPRLLICAADPLNALTLRAPPTLKIANLGAPTLGARTLEALTLGSRTLGSPAMPGKPRYPWEAPLTLETLETPTLNPPPKTP